MCFTIITSLVYGISAQEKEWEKLVSIGISQPILNNGTGLHIGFNPSLTITPKFSTEAQISFIYTEINNYFISGGTGNENAANVLAGGRFYINSSENKNRFFVNLLVGLNYNRDKKIGREIREESGLGFSIGSYYNFKKANIGITYDTHHMVLKFGYSF